MCTHWNRLGEAKARFIISYEMTTRVRSSSFTSTGKISHDLQIVYTRKEDSNHIAQSSLVPVFHGHTMPLILQTKDPDKVKY